MRASVSIKDKMKAWEGLRLTAYRCPAGVWTIGYGHTGNDVSAGQVITRAKADELFDRDLNVYEATVSAMRLNVNQRQFDALVSFAYNVGLAALRRSTLLRKVTANPDDPTIRDEFMRWVNGGGKRLPGLVARRSAEADHYFRKS